VDRFDDEQRGTWLDLCCGSGRALIEAARAWPAGPRELDLGADDGTGPGFTGRPAAGSS
jgi:hypothetical protein